MSWTYPRVLPGDRPTDTSVRWFCIPNDSLFGVGPAYLAENFNFCGNHPYFELLPDGTRRELSDSELRELSGGKREAHVWTGVIGDAHVTCRRRIDDPTLEEWQRKPGCMWGMSGWCGQKLNHAKCTFTAGADAIGDYGDYVSLDDFGHRWVCQCPCHANQGFTPCPGDHTGFESSLVELDGPLQVTLF